jgi:FKBP-type peptidyl-prolyl cis-trans isomerase FkpA
MRPIVTASLALLCACAPAAIPKPPPGPAPLGQGQVVVIEPSVDAIGTGVDTGKIAAAMEEAATAQGKSLKVVPRGELQKVLRARGVNEPKVDRTGQQAVDLLKNLGAEYALFGVVDRAETTGVGMLLGIVTAKGDREANWVRGEQNDLIKQLPREVGAIFQEIGASATDPVKYPDGLVLEIKELGTGPKPRVTERVKVNYEGRLDDGTIFDSSFRRSEPAVFGLDRVIICWQEAIPKLRVGSKAQITCPPGIAYGERGQPPSIPPNATLHFKVELLSIEK